jgi:ubiquitin C
MADAAAALQLLPPARIWVRLLTGKYLAFPVFLSDTISLLKHSLESRDPSFAGRRDRDLTFVFAGRELRPVETFSACGIVNDSVVQLIPAGELAKDYDSWITIVTDSGRFRYGILNNETIDDFIERFKEGEHWVPSSVVFAGQPLPGKRTFEACGVSTGAILSVPSIAGIGVRVRTLTGKELWIWPHRNARVEELKQLVQAAEGIPPDEQRMIFAAKQLDDENTISEYWIQPGSLIQLVLRLKG